MPLSLLARSSLYSLFMKVGIPAWNGWISPVFDVARDLLVVEAQDGAEVSRSKVGIEETAVVVRAKRVADLGINVLICGAISRPLEQMLVSSGLRVIPHTCGPVEEVLQAFLSERLTEQAFLMPGCCGRRRRFRGRRRGGQAREGT